MAHANRPSVHANRSIAVNSFEAVHPKNEAVRAGSSTASSGGSIVLATGSIAVPIDTVGRSSSSSLEANGEELKPGERFAEANGSPPNPPGEGGRRGGEEL
jgi:hypothetical protein